MIIRFATALTLATTSALAAKFGFSIGGAGLRDKFVGSSTNLGSFGGGAGGGFGGKLGGGAMSNRLGNIGFGAKLK